jgi:hypothetical protein
MLNYEVNECRLDDDKLGVVDDLVSVDSMEVEVDRNGVTAYAVMLYEKTPRAKLLYELLKVRCALVCKG